MIAPGVPGALRPRAGGDPCLPQPRRRIKRCSSASAGSPHGLGWRPCGTSIRRCHAGRVAPSRSWGHAFRQRLLGPLLAVCSLLDSFEEMHSRGLGEQCCGHDADREHCSWAAPLLGPAAQGLRRARHCVLFCFVSHSRASTRSSLCFVLFCLAFSRLLVRVNRPEASLPS